MRIVVFLCLIYVNGISQTSLYCTSGPREFNTRASWDWYNTPTSDKTRWDIYLTNILRDGKLLKWVSPFYNGNNLNVGHLNLNDNFNRDYKQEDGWEFLNYGLGNKNIINHDINPIFIFYNKYSSKLRIFYLLDQLESSVQQNVSAQKPGFINISNNPTKFRYNILSHNSSPLKALNEMPYEIIGANSEIKDDKYSYANFINSETPQWLFADFQTAYDPCVCHNGAGEFKFELGVANSSDVNFNIESIPPPIVGTGLTAKTNNGNSGGVTLKQIDGIVKGASTAFKNEKEAINGMNEYIGKIYPKDSKKYEDTKFSQGLSIASKVVGFIPVAGDIINSAIGIFDFFTGLSKEEPTPEPTGPPANTPVVIMNNFKASGTISSITYFSTKSIPVPASEATNNTTNYEILYNNPLGVFNLTEKPKVQEYKFGILNPMSISFSYFRYLDYKSYYVLRDDLKYVINPVLGFEIDKSTLRVAMEIEDCQRDNSDRNAMITSNNLTTNLTIINSIQDANNLPNFTSKYYDIECAKGLTTNLHIISQFVITSGGFAGPFFSMANSYECLNNTTPRTFIKVAAVFRKTLPDGTKIEVPWIGKFEAEKLAPITINAPLALTVEDLKADIVIDSPLNITTNTTMTASNSITINANITVATGVTLTLQAPVIYKNNAILTGSVIETSDMGAYANTIVCNKGITPQTAAQIETFCKGNLAGQYKPASRRLEEDLLQTDLVIENISLKNTPNPVQNKATIHYELSQNSSSVNLTVYDAMGNTVLEVLKNEIVAAGVFKYELTEGILPNGLYIVRLTTETESKSVKMIVE